MASKWADYLVSAVRYEDAIFKSKISNLKVHLDNEDTVGSGLDWTRSEVVLKIESGYSFYTIYKGDNGWKKGSEIHIVKIDGVKYLRTDANKIKKDNLGELPEF